jgi:hypothetical protein
MKNDNKNHWLCGHSLLFLGIKAKNFFIVIQILRKTRNDTYPINKLFNKFLVNYILTKLGRLADGRGWNPSKNSLIYPVSLSIYINYNYIEFISRINPHKSHLSF